MTRFGGWIVLATTPATVGTVLGMGGTPLQKSWEHKGEPHVLVRARIGAENCAAGVFDF